MCTVVLVWSKECFHDLSAGLSIGLREIWFGSYSNEIEHIDWVVWPMEWMISRSIVGFNRSLGPICFWEESEWVSCLLHQLTLTHPHALQPPIEPKVDYPGDTQNFELFDDEPLQAPECSREESDRFDQFWSSRKSMWNKTLRSINVLLATDSASRKNRDFLLSKHRVLSFFLTRTVCQPMHRLVELVVQRLRHHLCQRQI